MSVNTRLANDQTARYGALIYITAGEIPERLIELLAKCIFRLNPCLSSFEERALRNNSKVDFKYVN